MARYAAISQGNVPKRKERLERELLANVTGFLLSSLNEQKCPVNYLIL